MSDFTELPDLASERLGGAVEEATDEFFAPKENLLKEAAPVWKEGEYTDRGKWMDGWETRRHRAPDHDWCVIRLGLAGIIRGVVVDTANFKGNFPEACSLEGRVGDTWIELLPRVDLAGDSRNRFPVRCDKRVTHLRFHIYPDGGVARLRVHGEVVPDVERLRRQGEFDVAALPHGGHVTGASDRFFSAPHHLLLADRPRGMHDGWETRRRRIPGFDWVNVALGAQARVRRVEIDTSFFRGNFPESAAVAGRVGAKWVEIVHRTKMQAHATHAFDVDVADVDSVRLELHPDGGVARLRVYGMPTERGWRALGTAALWASADPRSALLACCGSEQWAEAVATARGEVHEAADAAFDAMDDAAWRAAFASHPAIGASVAGWSASEQRGMEVAGATEKERMAALNARYQDTFGYVFLICATGRSAGEMAAEAERRLGNAPEIELREAAAELRKITHLRIGRLLAGA